VHPLARRLAAPPTSWYALRVFQGNFDHATPVDVVVAPSVDEFTEQYVRRERPVVVRGGLSDWGPMKRWTLDYLQAASGTRPVKIGVSKTGIFRNYADRFDPKGDPEVALADVIDGIFAAPDGADKRRLHQQPLAGWEPLDSDVVPIPYMRRRSILKNIWMGSAGNVTKAHYDTEDNVNVQILGRKEFIIFPSSQLEALYPRRPWEYMSNFSRVEIASPDRSRFPRFTEATPMRAVIGPGDFLYLPVYWWHQVHTLEPSLNVNFWYQARLDQAARWNGVRYWPRMARDGYLQSYVFLALRRSIESARAG
jgi:hypothetical protein